MTEPAGVEVELEGLAEEVVDGPPKKSRPSKESEVFVGFGAAADFAGGGLTVGVSVVLGLTGGAGTSPKRSTCCEGLEGGGTGWLEVDAFRCDEARFSLAFSCTTLSGTSSSPSASRDAGSGIGPSIIHLLDSYFVLIKFSIFASEGT